jgi:glycosyltransferase involved in cell wall biosynthesis
VFHEQNRGYGGALRSGFAHATKDLVFYTDGDGQYDVFELRRLLPILQDGVDVVNGYKIARHDPLHRVVIGTVYLRLMRLLFNFHVRDVDCDFRLVRRSVFDVVTLEHSSGVICLELVKKLELAGFRFAEYPVHHYHRTYGRSQFFRVGRLARVAVNIGRLWWQLIVRRRSPRNVAHVRDATLTGGQRRQVPQ